MFSIKTDKIWIYPFGGITKLEMNINENPIKELLILIMGPIFQNLAFIMLLFLIKEKEMITIIHFSILVFNLLPIYPLDGGKLLNLLLNILFSYKKSLHLSIAISYLLAILFLLWDKAFSLNRIMVFLMIIALAYKEEKKISMYFNKFLMERILKDHTHKKIRIIKNIRGLYRYYNNVFKVNNHLYLEREYLLQNYKIFKEKC